MDSMKNIIAMNRDVIIPEPTPQRNVPDPQHGVSRRGYETPEEAFDECDECGPIIPRYVKLTGRWLKGTCACYEKKYLEQQQWQALMRWQVEQVKDNYCWLGDDWNDSALSSKTFSAYNPTSEQLADCLQAVQEWMDDMHGALILYSESYGTGKTHLLAALVNSLRMAGKAARFTTAPNLFEAIQARVAHNEPYTQLIHKAINTPLLVLDDIDKARPNESRQETYFKIIDERTKRGLPIALSTNRVNDLAAYVGGAASSRLKISQIALDMNGEDYRDRL